MRESELDALLIAVDARDAEKVATLLARDPGMAWAPVPAAGSAGSQETTLLHRVIPSDGERLTDVDVFLVRALLDAGADVDAMGWGTNNGVCTPLTMAAWGGHTPLVNLLLSRGAAPNGPVEQVARHHRPIDTAAAHGHSEVVEALIQGGADFSLSHLLQVGLTARVDNFLRQNPGAANIPLKGGTPPLLLAADAATVQFLLAAGADASACDLLGRNALHAAIEGERHAVVQALLDAGCIADIFATAGLGDSGRVGALLDADAGLARTTQGDSVTALFYAACAGKVRSCELLLAHGASVSPRARRFWACLTPLHVALQRGHRDVATLLLKNGADPNAFAAGEDGYWPTPLHAAVRWGNAVDVALLLDHGADPNGGDCGDGAGSFGTSGLTWAVFAGNEDAVRLLLARGLDLCHPAHQGVLHMAAEHGRFEVARFLMDNGADRYATDALGETAGQRALRIGHVAIAALLEA